MHPSWARSAIAADNHVTLTLSPSWRAGGAEEPELGPGRGPCKLVETPRTPTGWVRGRGGLAHAIRWRLVNSGAVAPVPIARGKTLRPQVNVRVTGLSVDGRLGVPLEGDDDPGAARFSFSAGRPLSLRPPIKQEPRLSQAAGVPRRPDRRGGVQTLHPVAPIQLRCRAPVPASPKRCYAFSFYLLGTPAPFSRRAGRRLSSWADRLAEAG
jgi:hypothetical protein